MDTGYPQSPPKSSSAMLFFILFIVLCAGGGGAYYVLNKSSSESTSSSSGVNSSVHNSSSGVSSSSSNSSSSSGSSSPVGNSSSSSSSSDSVMTVLPVNTIQLDGDTQKLKLNLLTEVGREIVPDGDQTAVRAPTGFWTSETSTPDGWEFYYLKTGYEGGDDYYEVDTCVDKCGILSPESTKTEIHTAIQHVIDYVYSLTESQFEEMRQNVWRRATTTNVQIGDTSIVATSDTTGVIEFGATTINDARFGNIDSNGHFNVSIKLLEIIFQNVNGFQNTDVSADSETDVTFQLGINLFPILYAFQMAAMMCRINNVQKPIPELPVGFQMSNKSKGDYLKEQFGSMIDAQIE